MKNLLLSLILGVCILSSQTTAPPGATTTPTQLLSSAWIDSPAAQMFAGLTGTSLPVFTPYLFVIATVVNQLAGASYTITVAGTTKLNTVFGNTLPAHSDGSWTVFVFPLTIGDTFGSAPIAVTYSTMSGTVNATILKN